MSLRLFMFNGFDKIIKLQILQALFFFFFTKINISQNYVFHDESGHISAYMDSGMYVWPDHMQRLKRRKIANSLDQQTLKKRKKISKWEFENFSFQKFTVPIFWDLEEKLLQNEGFQSSRYLVTKRFCITLIVLFWSFWNFFGSTWFSCTWFSCNWSPQHN